MRCAHALAEDWGVALEWKRGGSGLGEVDAILETESGENFEARGHLAKVTRVIPRHTLEMKTAMGYDGLS